ncbi:MAG: hypothetical protein QGG36_22660 [Pirellulaceae bacterium]|nr:hypothetical protein [Pirellulaceae bacterium]MDP7018618.1 hypothetical protein [Pirellulaceae bacterium]
MRHQQCSCGQTPAAHAAADHSVSRTGRELAVGCSFILFLDCADQWNAMGSRTFRRGDE